MENKKVVSQRVVKKRKQNSVCNKTEVVFNSFFVVLHMVHSHYRHQ